MGKFSELDLEGDSPHFSEDELRDLQRQCALADLRELRSRLLKAEDRMKYYKEEISLEILTRITTEVTRIIKLLS